MLAVDCVLLVGEGDISQQALCVLKRFGFSWFPATVFVCSWDTYTFLA